MENNNKLFRTSLFLVLILLLCLVTGCMNRCEQPIDKTKRHSQEKYGLQVAEKNQMQLLIVGSVNDVFSDYCMLFTSDKEMSLEQGKALAIPIAKNYLEMILHDPTVADYVANKRGKAPQANNIGLKIAFWDQDVNRPKPPYLAEIMLSKGVFHYYEADPQTQSLKLITTEPFE